MAFSAAEIRACNLCFLISGHLQLCLPAPDILSRRQVRRAQPEKLIIEREHLGVFGDCVREQHPATVAAVFERVLIARLKGVIGGAVRDPRIGFVCGEISGCLRHGDFFTFPFLLALPFPSANSQFFRTAFLRIRTVIRNFDIAFSSGVIQSLRFTPVFGGNTGFGMLGEELVLQCSPVRFCHVESPAIDIIEALFEGLL
jgi:hypothetical protein